MMMLVSASAPQASLHTYKDPSRQEQANGSAKAGAETEVYHDYPDSVMARRTLLTNIDKSVNVIQASHFIQFLYLNNIFVHCTMSRVL